MQRVSLKILKWFGVAVLSLVGIILMAVIVFAVMPEVIVPQWLIKKGLSYAPRDAKLDYELIDVRFVKESLNKKRLQFNLKNVCLDYQDSAIHLCFDELSGGLAFSFFAPDIKRVEPLRLIDARLTANLNKLKSEDEQKEPSNFDAVDFLRRKILPKWEFPGTIVELKKIDLTTGENRFVTSLYIDAANEGSTALKLRVPEFKEVNKGFPQFNLNYSLRWPSSETQNYKSVGQLKLQPAAKQAIAVNLETTSSSWDDITYDLKSKINGIAPLDEVALNGHYTKTDADGILSVQMGGPQSEIKQLNFLKCKYAIELDEKRGDLKCGPQQVNLALKERPTFKNKPALFKLAPTFELRVSDFSYEKGVKANYDFKLNLDHLNFVTADISVEGNVDGSGKKFKYLANTTNDIVVNDFASLVKFLRDTPAAIPAPVNVMGGKITLKIDGSVNEQNGKINFAFNPDLKSEHQRLLFTLGGNVDLENRAKGMYTKLTLDSNLKDVKLSLPRIELAAPPQFVTDKRFNLAEKRAQENDALKSGSTFAYDVDVTTPKVGSIAVATNLTKNPIPIGVNLNADSETGVGPGTIEIGRVALELFRRKAFLEELDVNLQPNGEKFLKGKIAINYLDYDISIRVSGSTDAPKVVMESSPPLSQDEIISVLLFGKTPEELDETERSSVGNTSAALADKALSFSSLYFLASTPIESVGYDAQRGVVTAKVGLGKGTSLELGSSGQELAEVGVRRRLGHNWYLNSYVEEDPQTDDRSVAAFIEWVRRF